MDDVGIFQFAVSFISSQRDLLSRRSEMHFSYNPFEHREPASAIRWKHMYPRLGACFSTRRSHRNSPAAFPMVVFILEHVENV